jgi:hypothetical protein
MEPFKQIISSAKFKIFFSFLLFVGITSISNTQTWTQIGADIDGEAASDSFGKSISLSADGSVLAIGAPANDGNGNHSGHVRIYQNNGGTWSQIGNDLNGEAAYDSFGTSISLNSDGSVVAIGAPFNDGVFSDVGEVSIYQNISGTWTQIGVDIEGFGPNNLFGFSISLGTVNK